MSFSKVISGWRAERPSGITVPCHKHPYYEIVYYPEGSGKLQIGEKSHSFGKDDFSVLPPETEHSESYLCGGRVICATLDSSLPLRGGLYHDDTGKLAGIMEEMADEIRCQPPQYRAMLAAKADELALRIFRMTAAEPHQPKQLEFAVRFLEQNYREPVSLVAVAAQIGYSYDYFHHRFKEENGISPRAFLVRRRMQAAKELLTDTNLSCTEIAGRCGFCSSAQFAKQFRQMVGMAPSEYRKEHFQK